MGSTDLLESRNEYLLNNFERALKEGWIEIYVQPVVRSSNGKVCEEEALARWEDPVLGVLNPFDFLPFLEEAGLTECFDLYILEKVLEKMQGQIDAGVPLLSTSINFSRLSFQSRDIIKKIEKRVNGAGISKQLITFEIADGTASTENFKTIAQLARLKELGYRIELDDYGNGDISLLLSQEFRFDAVKINMSVIRQSLINENARIILSEL